MYSAYALSNTIIEIADEKAGKQITLDELQRILFSVCQAYQALTDTTLIDDFFTQNRITSIDNKLALHGTDYVPLIVIPTQQGRRVYKISRNDKRIRKMILSHIHIYFQSKT